MANVFTGPEFLKALAEGSFQEDFVREGLAKIDEDDPASIQFSDGTSCSLWTKIPAGMIKQVESLRTINCRDHHHQYVRLHLKGPKESEAAVFASLLKNAGPGQRPQTNLRTREAASAVARLDEGEGQVPPVGHSGGLNRGVIEPAEAGELRAAATSADAPGVTDSHESLPPAALVGVGNWTRIASFTFNNYYSCVYVYKVHVHRRRRTDNRWSYAVQIENTWVQTFGSCSCGPIPGQYRTGYVRAKVLGTGGGFLDTGDLDVHSGGGIGGDKWQYFDPANPGEMTQCQLFCTSWCTF